MPFGCHTTPLLSAGNQCSRRRPCENAALYPWRTGLCGWSACLDGRRGKRTDRKSTRLNSSHLGISYAVFCLKKKNLQQPPGDPQFRESQLRVEEYLARVGARRVVDGDRPGVVRRQPVVAPERVGAPGVRLG